VHKDLGVSLYLCFLADTNAPLITVVAIV